MAHEFTEAEVFGIDPNEFMSMSFKDRLRITKAAGSLAVRFVDQTFDNGEADWIVIGDVPPRVIASGGYGEDPSDEELTQIGADNSVTPYFFSRPEWISPSSD